MMKRYKLLAPDYEQIIPGQDNPASIPDNIPFLTASAYARKWMAENEIYEAVLMVEDNDF